MKPYSELTRLGRLRRLRRLAHIDLETYGLSGARLTFLEYGGNVIFRVDLPGPTPNMSKKSPYIENRYVLRILTLSDTEAVESELAGQRAARSSRRGRQSPARPSHVRRNSRQL